MLLGTFVKETMAQLAPFLNETTEVKFNVAVDNESQRVCFTLFKKDYLNYCRSLEKPDRQHDNRQATKQGFQN